MSKKLESILELLLAEENEKAEELLHEYVVDKAREQYESLLDDEVEGEEAVEETVEDMDEVVDQSNDFESDVTSDEEEIHADEIGEVEDEEESEEAESEDLPF